MASDLAAYEDPSRYAAWLVDLDGTLYHARGLKCAMMAELVSCGVWHVPLLRTFRHEHERLRTLPPISATTPDTAQGIRMPTIGSSFTPTSPYAIQIERTAAASGQPLSRVQAVTTRWMIERPLKWLPLFRRSDLIARLESYKARGGRLALVSDYPAQRKLQALGCAHLFDVVVANGEPGGPPQLKPKPDGYLLAANKLGVPPEQCLIIGDRTDADGAAADAAKMEFFKV